MTARIAMDAEIVDKRVRVQIAPPPLTVHVAQIAQIARIARIARKAQAARTAQTAPKAPKAPTAQTAQTAPIKSNGVIDVGPGDG
jgi:hypothetical protein